MSRADTDKKIIAGALVALFVALVSGTRAGVLPKLGPDPEPSPPPKEKPDGQL